MEKTQEKPRLTKQERAFVEAIRNRKYWIARDGNGCLYMYDEEVYQLDFVWDNYKTHNIFSLNNSLFPFITWESEKAWSKADLLALEVEE